MSPPDHTQDTLSPSERILAPSLSRATSTSALSVVSIESTVHQSSPRQLLSRPRTALSSASTTFISAPQTSRSIGESSNAGRSSSSTPSSKAVSLWDHARVGSTPSTPRSRKGKERALPEEEDGSQVPGELDLPSKDAERALRQLAVTDDGVSAIEGRNAEPDLVELHERSDHDRIRHTRQYFVLTDAGKPVFQSHPELNEHSGTDLMGVAQTLISIFADEEDRMRCIVRGKHRIAFVLRAPLYLFCVSDWGEPEHVLRVHLDYIHLQILSVVSSTQLSKAFQRRSNFDLSRLLEGTENFLHHLIERCQYDFSFLTSTLQPLRMSPVLREAAAASLIPPARFKDLLYVLLVAEGHIVTLLRPKKHSIHPSDLHLLLNMLASSNSLRSTETWIPICFPKFNPAGFVHAYISYVTPNLGLVFISADRDAFEELRVWRATVVQNLEKEKTLSKIEQSIAQHTYTVDSLGCSGLRHFIYKSRQHVQITMPEWPEHNKADGQDRRRLVTMYQRLHNSLHGRSGQSGPLKLVYLRSEREAYLAWVTRPFELYIALSPTSSKSAAVASANIVARWVVSEEARIFLKDAPVF